MDPIKPRGWLEEMLQASDSRWRRVDIPDESEPAPDENQTTTQLTTCKTCGQLSYTGLCEPCMETFAKPLAAWYRRVPGLYRATYDLFQCSELYNMGGDWIADVWDALYDANIDAL